MKKLFAELMRRNVIRVGAAYLVAGWVILQIADVLIDFLEMPDWSGKLLVLILALGFPLALVFAWAFELTPEGLKSEAEFDRTIHAGGATAKKLDLITIALVVITLAVFTGDRFLSSEKTHSERGVSTSSAVPLDASVAVLPFENISQDASNDPFTIGIHDDLITQISKISSLKTISRTSVLRYGDHLTPIPQIAAELGVATVLEGSVQQSGNLVRINVQLIDADTNGQLWGESYERQLTASNIFAIQNDIVKAIADALYTKLTPDEQVRIEKAPTENLAALELYFQGRQAMGARHSVALQEAIEYFEQAIALDPDFALAYIGLSVSYQLQEDAGSLSRDEMFAQALPAINKAFELDSELGPAYNSLGGLKFSEGNYLEAEQMFRKSIELNPNYATTYLWYGLLLVDLGRIEEAIIQFRHGIERDPLSSQLLESLGTAMEYQGRFDVALKQYQKSTEVNTTFATSYTYIGNIYWMVSGRISDALACLRKSVDLDPGARLAQAYLGLLYLDLGDVPQANQWITSSLQLAPDSLEPRAAMVLLDNFRGNGIEWTENAAAVQDIKPYYPDARLLQTMSLALLRNHELQEGRIDKARDLYEKNYSALLNDDVPVIDWQNYRPAIDLALVLQKSGDRERAEILLDHGLAFIESGKVTRLGIQGYGIADVQIYALKGKQQQALTALRQALKQGWRGFWWFYLKNNPNLESLQDSTEFQTMAQNVELFMTSQRTTLGEADSCTRL
jgi:TolB-like protein/Tfp pilus assembly protein PilF